jgi:hypothetical protein
VETGDREEGIMLSVQCLMLNVEWEEGPWDGDGRWKMGDGRWEMGDGEERIMFDVG